MCHKQGAVLACNDKVNFALQRLCFYLNVCCIVVVVYYFNAEEQIFFEYWLQTECEEQQELQEQLDIIIVHFCYLCLYNFTRNAEAM